MKDDTTVSAEDREWDERTLRQRLESNPRPAIRWAIVALVLFALELGRFAEWVIRLGEIVRFTLSGFAAAPGWVGSNVADVLGPLAGTIVVILISLAILYVVSIPLGRLVPERTRENLSVHVRRLRPKQVDRLLVTLVLAVAAVLILSTPVGMVVDTVIGLLRGLLEAIASLPKLTGRDTVPNIGHRTVDGGWEGTFLGLSPAWAWAIRVSLVIGYVVVSFLWLWRGYNVFREEYRAADWTPRDDTIRRFRNHYWGLFGLLIVGLFVIMALWAPAVSPVTAQENIFAPYAHEFQYLNDDGEPELVTHGTANLASQSDGQNTVGPLSYDSYDRWAPLGTTPRGQDMLTHLAYGAQTSLAIGLIAIGLGGLIAVVLSLISSYYKGIVDVATILASDTVISIPALLLVMMMSVLFNQGDHFLADPMDGGLLLALIFAFVYWPGIWRAIRGPSLQVAEEQWVDAAKSYGQTPWMTMRKHMAPYLAAYVMIYASLLLGGVIIFTAALSFLGLGISHPTPEWGRLIDNGQPYVATRSWHVATIAGLMIVFVVTAFNALGDGIRDAIDPESAVGSGDDATATAAGGGG